MPAKDKPQRDLNREDATIGDQQQQTEREHEASRRRKKEGPTRHGPQPPKRGLEGDEPFHQATGGRDKREGVISQGSFRHVEKEGKKSQPERGEEE